MSEQPDLSTLPKQMRYVARVLEKVSTEWSERTGCRLIGNAWEKNWSAQGIENAAKRWEFEDGIKVARDAEMEELARALGPIVWAQASFDDLPDYNQKFCRRAACGLIDSGWRKVDAK